MPAWYVCICSLNVASSVAYNRQGPWSTSRNCTTSSPIRATQAAFTPIRETLVQADMSSIIIHALSLPHTRISSSLSRAPYLEFHGGTELRQQRRSSQLQESCRWINPQKKCKYVRKHDSSSISLIVISIAIQRSESAANRPPVGPITNENDPFANRPKGKPTNQKAKGKRKFTKDDISAPSDFKLGRGGGRGREGREEGRGDVLCHDVC